MLQKTLKTSVLIKVINKKTNKNFGPHESFEKKNILKPENSQNVGRYQSFKKNSTNVPQNSGNARIHKTLKITNY